MFSNWKCISIAPLLKQELYFPEASKHMNYKEEREVVFLLQSKNALHKLPWSFAAMFCGLVEDSNLDT